MNKELIEEFVGALKKVLPQEGCPYPLHEPSFCGREWEYVKDCLDTGWVSSIGGYVDRFEQMVGEITETAGAVATVNGTAALHVCLLLAGVTREDEVLVPALTFVATANAVAYCGAIPHFVDSEERSLGVDPDKLSDYLHQVAIRRDGQLFNRVTGRRIAALIVVHIFGHPAAMEDLRSLCGKFGIKLIEDAAGALGSYYQNRHVGGLSDIAAFSFNGNKILTTGGGGAIVSNNPAYLERARKLTTTARSIVKGQYVHDETAFNYRMPNINAALGCAQLERLKDYLGMKRRLAMAYADSFRNIDGVGFLTEPKYACSNYWLNAIVFDDGYASIRCQLLQKAEDSGYHCRPAWRLMSQLPMYSHCPRMPLDCAERMQACIVNIPSSFSQEI